ncbi:hypothetical protein EVAR_13500_1 [Eumeta japonica]|uniref:Uncharacterized protein n=1 Tax=Eumeta variegata TaxID=151549 RepID=A0A4C1UYQ8_EUMVA|nr:hypothetical protein EVAR_13500_1 [Eumeta japonica]
MNNGGETLRLYRHIVFRGQRPKLARRRSCEIADQQNQKRAVERSIRVRPKRGVIDEDLASIAVDPVFPSGLSTRQARPGRAALTKRPARRGAPVDYLGVITDSICIIYLPMKANLRDYSEKLRCDQLALNMLKTCSVPRRAPPPVADVVVALLRTVVKSPHTLLAGQTALEGYPKIKRPAFLYKSHSCERWASRRRPRLGGGPEGRGRAAGGMSAGPGPAAAAVAAAHTVKSRVANAREIYASPRISRSKRLQRSHQSIVTRLKSVLHGRRHKR